MTLNKFESVLWTLSFDT